MQGILVGTDKAQEWLLPWWWEHYTRHNDYPVAFADFGMSDEARNWCAEKGRVIEIPAEDIPFPTLSLYEARENRWLADLYPIWIERVKKNEELCEKRRVWFKKPLAFSLSPFPHSLWLDLDCEVRGNLEMLFILFPFIEPKFGATFCGVEDALTNSGVIKLKCYNTGIVLFEPSSPVIKLWLEYIHRSKFAIGDDYALSELLWDSKISIFELPENFHGRLIEGPNEKALIFHWAGDEGKEAIRQSLKTGQPCKAF